MGMFFLLFITFQMIPQKKPDHIVLVQEDPEDSEAKDGVDDAKEARRKAREARKNALLER